MRLLDVLFILLVLIFNLLIVQTRSIVPSTTTLMSVNSARQESKFEAEAIRYKEGDSSQVEILDDGDGDGDEERGSESDESTTTIPTVDPAFVELSRQAFFRLNQGQQYIKPVVQTDEERRLLWLGEHNKRKQNGDNQLPGKRQVMTLTTVDQLDRNQTCKSDMFRHKIRMAGCEPKIIMNRFCHGACSSFYIPKLRSKKLKATFKSCAACIPVETDFIKVQLECPDRPEKQMFRTVVRVKRCACRNINFGVDDDNEDEDY